jgi:hydrogenase maturation protease
MVLFIRNGEFVSMIDPPGALREQAALCKNVGCWPVLVGDPGEKDTILSAPIILYDYPKIAPESPGELFDGTEIDEILTLRIMTLTDEEKAAMAAVDERARAVLARTESLGKDEMMSLHGTFRGLQGLTGEPTHG